MLETAQKVIRLIGKKFPHAIYLQRSEGKNPREPVAHFFRLSSESFNILFLFLNSHDRSWSVTQYECPSKEDYDEFAALWYKWGLFNKILEWKHEEVNVSE